MNDLKKHAGGCVTVGCLAEFLVVAAVFFSFSVAAKYYLLPPDEVYAKSYRLEWILCARYIDDGVIYRSGTPYCVQPPLLHYSVWFLIKAAGLGNLELVLFTLTVLLNAASYILLRRILDGMRVSYSPVVLAVLVMFLVVETTINYYETALSTAFLLAGFYVLYHTECRVREFLGGILLFLSIMGKILTAPIIGLIVFHYFVSVSKANIRGAALPATLVVLSAATYFMFPGILGYTYTAHSEISRYSLEELIYIVSPFYKFLTKQHILYYVLGVYLTYLLVRNRDVVSLLSASSIPFLIRHLWTGGVEVISTLYYYVPFNAFIIVSLLKEADYSREDKVRHYVNAAVVVVLLLYGSHLYRLYPVSTVYVDPRIVELDQGLRYLPRDGGRILTGYGNIPYLDSILREVGSGIEDYEFDYLVSVPATYGIDYKVVTRMLEKGIIEGDTSPAEEPMTPYERSIYAGDLEANEKALKTLREGGYSILILAPPDYGLMLAAINSINISAYGCMVLIPNSYFATKGGAHLTKIMFKDPEACGSMRLSVAEYYKGVYRSVCSKSDFGAYLLERYVFPANGVAVKTSARCNTKTDWFQDKSSADGGADFTFRELASLPDTAVLMAFTAAATVAYSLYLRLSAKGGRRNLKTRSQRRKRLP